jgi:hypothetical protein
MTAPRALPTGTLGKIAMAEGPVRAQLSAAALAPTKLRSWLMFCDTFCLAFKRTNQSSRLRILVEWGWERGRGESRRGVAPAAPMRQRSR